MKKIIVLDTSAFIAGLLGEGAASEILRKFILCILIIAVNESILIEYARAIRYPKIIDKIDLSKAEAIISFILLKGINVRIEKEFNLSADKSDNVFLNTAYSAKSKYIITYDEDLLSLRDRDKILRLGRHIVYILKPREFLEIERI